MHAASVGRRLVGLIARWCYGSIVGIPGTLLSARTRSRSRDGGVGVSGTAWIAVRSRRLRLIPLPIRRGGVTGQEETIVGILDVDGGQPEGKHPGVRYLHHDHHGRLAGPGAGDAGGVSDLSDEVTRHVSLDGHHPIGILSCVFESIRVRQIERFRLGLAGHLPVAVGGVLTVLDHVIGEGHERRGGGAEFRVKGKLELEQ